MFYGLNTFYPLQYKRMSVYPLVKKNLILNFFRREKSNFSHIIVGKVYLTKKIYKIIKSMWI